MIEGGPGSNPSEDAGKWWEGMSPVEIRDADPNVYAQLFGSDDPNIVESTTNPPASDVPTQSENLDKQEAPSYSLTDEQRNAILRHADNYLMTVDTEREEAVTKSPLARIKERITGSNRRQFRDVILSAHDEESWQRALHPEKYYQNDLQKKLKVNIPKPKNDERQYQLTEKDKKRIEELARYRAAIKYRDEAVKLIKELRDNPNIEGERESAINNELNHLFYFLMVLAHTDSYRVIYEQVGKTYRKTDQKPHQRGLNESGEEYRNRIAPKMEDRRLKDARIYIPPNPNIESPPLQPEQMANNTVEPINPPVPPQLEPSQVISWADNRLEGEKTREFSTRLEGPVKVPGPELGDQLLANELISYCNQLAQYKKEDLLKLGVELKIDKSGIVYTEVTKNKNKEKTEACKTYKLTLKLDTGKYLSLTIYSDGCNEGDKKVSRPTQNVKGKPIENK